MSSFRVHATEIRRYKALVEAMVDRAKAYARTRRRSEAEAEAAVREHVELHLDSPAQLNGYAGDQSQSAEVILRQPYCAELLGCASYEDVGFRRTQDGVYEAIMGSHDAWWADEGRARFEQYAAASEGQLEAELEGYEVHLEEIGDGLLEVVCDSIF